MRSPALPRLGPLLAIGLLVSAPALAGGGDYFSAEQTDMLAHLAQANAYNRTCKLFLVDPGILDERLKTVGLSWNDAVVQSFVFYRADMLIEAQHLHGGWATCGRAYAEYGPEGSVMPFILWLPEKLMGANQKISPPPQPLPHPGEGLLPR